MFIRVTLVSAALATTRVHRPWMPEESSSKQGAPAVTVWMDRVVSTGPASSMRGGAELSLPTRYEI